MTFKITHNNAMKKDADLDYTQLSEIYSTILYVKDYIYDATSNLENVSETTDDLKIVRDIDGIINSLDAAYEDAVNAHVGMNELLGYIKKEYGL